MSAQFEINTVIIVLAPSLCGRRKVGAQMILSYSNLTCFWCLR